MTDAPKEIWAFWTPDDFEDGATITAYETVQHGGQRYIRADLVLDPLEQAADRAALAELEDKADE